MRSLLYEWNVIKKKCWLPILLIVIILAILIGAFYIPFAYGTLGEFGFADPSDKNGIIMTYRMDLSYILDEMRHGIFPKNYKIYERRIFSYYIDNDITEYEVFLFEYLFCRRKNVDVVACCFSVLEAAKFLCMLLPLLLTSYLFTTPLDKNRLRPMLTNGGNRRGIFITKNAIMIGLIFLISLGVCIFSLIKMGPYLNETTMIAYYDTYVEVPLIECVISRVLGMIILGLFVLGVSEFLALQTKKHYCSGLSPFIVIILCFVLSMNEIPSWGYYRELEQPGNITALLIPFANLIIVPAFGFIKESIIILAIYGVSSVGLMAINTMLFERKEL